jgi:hypothetical protein
MKTRRAPPFRPEPARMLSIYDGRDCIGFLLCGGEHKVEAFDFNDKSLGHFDSLKKAAAAVSMVFENRGAHHATAR